MSETELDRRTFIKASAGATATAAAGGATLHSPRLSPVGQSEAALPIGAAAWGAVKIGGLILGGGAAGWAARGFFAPSESDFEEARSEEAWARVYSDAIEIESRAQEHLDVFNPLLDNVREFVRTNVAFQIEENVALGVSKSATITDVEEEVEESVSYWLERHAENWNQRSLELGRRSHLLREEFSDGVEDDVFERTSEDGTEQVDGLPLSFQSFFSGGSQESYTLPNGDSVSVFEAGGPSTLFAFDEMPGEDDRSIARVSPPPSADSFTTFSVIEAADWAEITKDLEQLAVDEKDNAADLVDQLYDPLADGDVEIGQAASARTILDESEDPDNYGQAAGVYRSMSMPESDTRVVIQTEFAEIEGFLFRTVGGSELPAGETITPADEPGNIEIAGEILHIDPTYGPTGLDPKDITLNISRDGDPASLSEVEVIGADDIYDDVEDIVTEDTADTDGTAELTVDSRSQFVDIEIENDGDTMKTTLNVDTEDTFNLSFEADADDRENVDRGLLSYDLDVGDIVTGVLSEPFVITDTEDAVDTVEFSDPTFIDYDPDGDPDETADRLREAFEREQETREGVDDLFSDSTGGISGGGAGFLDDLTDFGASTIQTIVGGLILFILFIFGLNAASS